MIFYEKIKREFFNCSIKKLSLNFWGQIQIVYFQAEKV